MAKNKPTASPREWKGVTGGSTFGQTAMKTMFALVSVRVGYAIMAFVIPFYMLFARKGYLAIYRYFRARHHYPPTKSFLKTYLNHYRFGQTLLDRFAVYAGRRSFRADNPDNNLFLDMVNSDKGCIIATSHVGNPELCGYLLSQQTKRINSLIFGGEAKVVQQNRSTVLSANNVRLISVETDMSHIFIVNEALRNGEMLSLPCDRLFGSSKTVKCPFLGAEARFPIGGFVMAAQYDLPVIALFVMKASSKVYRIHVFRVTPPASPEADPKRRTADNSISEMSENAQATDNVISQTPPNSPAEYQSSSQMSENAQAPISIRSKAESMARAYASILEDIVKKYPEQWFNFYNFWKI